MDMKKIGKRVASGLLVVLGMTLGGCWMGPSANASTPPCILEDGSGQRACVWDAGHAGNGVGESFVYSHGSYRPVSERRARHMVRVWRHDHCTRTAPKQYTCDGWKRIHRK